MNTDTLITQLQQKAEDLVKHGGNLRADTARLVQDASGQFHAAAGGLNALVKAVTDGAVTGAKQTLPADTASVLSAVIDGITDGLAKSAQAVKLTLEESTASGTRFANEDLTKIGQDFRTLGTVITDIVLGAASALGGHAKDQANSLAAHAKQTVQAAWPPVESAIAAAQQHPTQLGRETVNAGAAAAKKAAGVLFSELGNYLQKAGQKLRE